jgi:hypothetical protein
MFRTSAAIYTAFVIAQRNWPNRPNCSGFYCEVLRRFLENLRRRGLELWREQTWLLHHDNAPFHTSVLAQQFLAKYKMAVIPHPPHSPDLAPNDFFLFPEMKLKLKGRRFDTIDEIQAVS